MDGKLVSGSLSDHDGSERESSLPIFTYTDKFNEQFPFYLSIGMTPEQYWDGDSELAKFYRKAEEIRTERKNQELWLQGMYVYEAICDASPILHDFAKRGTKPHPYVEKPYPLNRRQIEEEAAAKEKSIHDKGKQFMEAFMIQNNAKFKEKVQQ